MRFPYSLARLIILFKDLVTFFSFADPPACSDTLLLSSSSPSSCWSLCSYPGYEQSDQHEDGDEDESNNVSEHAGGSAKLKNVTKSLKRIINLAKLYGNLIGNGMLPITVLKVRIIHQQI